MACIVLVYSYISRNFAKISQGKLDDSNPFCILFYEYKSKHMVYSQYCTFFLLRRLGYSATLIFLRHWPFVQNSSYIVLAMCIFSYQLIFRPYKNTAYNWVMVLNELFLVAFGWMFYCFVDLNTNTAFTELMGWIWVLMVVVLVLFNLTTLWVIKISHISKTIKSLIKSWREK